MCAVAASTNKTTERVKPTFKIRNELSAYWVQKACSFSGKTPAQLVAALEEIPASRVSSGERKKYERYADENSNGSMNLGTLKKFIEDARAMGLLPPPSGLRHWSEFLMREDPEGALAEMLETSREFDRKKENLIGAITGYQACLAGAERAHVVVEMDSAGELWQIDDRAFADSLGKIKNSILALGEDLARLKQSIESHGLATTVKRFI